MIFGKGRDAADERARLTGLLSSKIDAVDRVCQLTATQKQRLRLAGRGDVKHLLDRALDTAHRFENSENIAGIDAFQKWAAALSAETVAVRSALKREPFDGNSLFAKALRTTLTPEQMAEYEQSLLDRLVISGGTIDPESLEDLLRGWERSASRIDRLDCDFFRFRYDKTFEIESRGTGSLAVDRMGRAAYRIAPENIGPGNVGRPIGKGGAPFKLQADEPQRWHWTGRSVIRVDEAARTFEEWARPGRSADGEFQPDPPELPQDARPRGAASEAVPNPVPEKPDPELPNLFEQIAGFAVVIVFGQALSQIDFAAFAEAIAEFHLARPFLLGMPLEELRRRFDLTLVKGQWPQAWLQFEPKQKDDRARFKRAILILNVESYVPVALKEVDDLGCETVHVFKNISVIPTGKSDDASLWKNRENLDRPNLKGYSKLGR